MKYKITDESIEFDGHVLYRIESLADFGDVKTGDKGGFVENEFNLSQKGTCWIFNDAKVYEDAMVLTDALVTDNACVHGKAFICDESMVCDNAEVFERAIVRDKARVCVNSRVGGSTIVEGHSCLMHMLSHDVTEEEIMSLHQPLENQ